MHHQVTKTLDYLRQSVSSLLNENISLKQEIEELKKKPSDPLISSLQDAVQPSSRRPGVNV